MKKALLLGDYTMATWHPLREVDEEIKRILSDYEIDICECYPALTVERLQEYDFVINYIDAYDSRGDADLAAAFITYVASGGVMMVLHNGIIAHKHRELEQMYGGAFTHHPKHDLLKFVHADSHPLGKTIMPFSVDEEPYMFTMSNIAEITILMNFEYKGERYPAVWVRAFGKGKILYITPGHNAKTFRNEGMEILIRQGALWCCSDLDFPQDNLYIED